MPEETTKQKETSKSKPSAEKQSSHKNGDRLAIAVKTANDFIREDKSTDATKLPHYGAAIIAGVIEALS